MTFAVIALLLALAGVYAVMAYSVNQRLPELGVRVALGASPSNIMTLVLGDGARLAAAGLTIGVGLSFSQAGHCRTCFSASPRGIL